VNIGLPSTVDDGGHYGEYFDSLGRAPTRTFERYMDEHWVANGFIIVNSYRVLSVVSVDIIVHAFVFLEVEVSIRVAFCATLLAILDLTM